MSFLRLKQLTPAFRQGAVVARVSRMWDYCGVKGGSDIQHVDLVLIDEEGTAMYAEIGAADVEAKKPLLTEGEIYVFKRFRVSNSKPTYRLVDSMFMIHITHLTLVEACPNPPPDIPLYVYKLTRFLDVPSLDGEIHNFLVGDEENIQFQNQADATHRRILILKDSKGSEIKIYLWGERAMEFDGDEICRMNEDKPDIIIFVSLLSKNYKGENFLNGASACR